MENGNKGISILYELKDKPFPLSNIPDVRGWLVKMQPGRFVGKISELLLDRKVSDIRYLIINVAGNDVKPAYRRIPFPFAGAQLNSGAKEVLLPYVSLDQLQALPEYDKNNFTRKTEIDINLILKDQTDTEMNLNNPAVGSAQKLKTVIGLFNTVVAANTTIAQLEKATIPREQIKLVTRNSAQESEAATISVEQPDYDKFFYSLFSSPSDAEANLEAARNSNAIVAVYTNTPEQTQLASSLIQEYNTANPVDTNPTDIAETSGAINNSIPSTAQSNNAVHPAHSITSNEDWPEASEKKQPANLDLDLQKDNLQNISQREMIRERKLTNATTELKDFTTFRPGIIELKEFTEVPVIKKVVRVVEEVSVQKIVEEHDGLVQDTVRRTEIDIQNLNQNNITPEK